jgi:hypothetical protein
VTETPEQRVARLEAELAQAKVEALQKQVTEARLQASPSGPSDPTAYIANAIPMQFAKRAFTPAPDDRLAPPPRSVPAGYRALVVPFSMWALFALFMIAVAPIALWIFVPIAAVATAAVAFVVVLTLLLRKSIRRNALLTWGEVATVRNAEVLGRGTYYSGTTVQNVRIAQAHGWQVERRWYSGPVTKTRIDYELRGTPASIVIRGLDYDNGVILADSRNPARAMCISSFPFDVQRDAGGNWTGGASSRFKVASFVMIDLLIAWTVGMCWLFGSQAADLPGLVRH